MQERKCHQFILQTDVRQKDNQNKGCKHSDDDIMTIRLSVFHIHMTFSNFSHICLSSGQNTVILIEIFKIGSFAIGWKCFPCRFYLCSSCVDQQNAAWFYSEFCESCASWTATLLTIDNFSIFSIFLQICSLKVFWKKECHADFFSFIFVQLSS